MKRLSKQEAGGFTRVELAVAITAIVVLAVLLAPSFRRARQTAWRIYCNNNLKQLGTAYRLWAGDHHDLVPAEASMTNGGWSELLTNSDAGQYCWTNYAVMWKEVGRSPKIVICPADERKPAANFIVKGATNDTANAAFKDNTTVSYFVGVTDNVTYPNSIQGGDRNLGPGLVPDPDYGYSPSNGNGNDVVIPISSPVSWSLKMHSQGNPVGAGNIMLGDGSVQEVSSGNLTRNWLPKAQTWTNFPRSATNLSGIRLVFP
jgi:type II secretory pathway pseudopilin PulG